MKGKKASKSYTMEMNEDRARRAIGAQFKLRWQDEERF